MGRDICIECGEELCVDELHTKCGDCYDKEPMEARPGTPPAEAGKVKMKSKTIPIYKKWLSTATPTQIEFCDQVYAICEENYENGGDRVVECWDPPSILDFFKDRDIEQVRAYCGLVVEQRDNARWGEDSEL